MGGCCECERTCAASIHLPAQTTLANAHARTSNAHTTTTTAAAAAAAAINTRVDSNEVGHETRKKLAVFSKLVLKTHSQQIGKGQKQLVLASQVRACD